MKFKIVFIGISLIGILLTACGGDAVPSVQVSAPTGVNVPAPTSEPTPTLIIPESGQGGLRLISPNAEDFWKTSLPVHIWAAPFVEGENGQGIYVLEPSIHPIGELAPGGVFQINNVPPGKYVLIVGPVPEDAVVIRKDGNPWIVEVNEGEVTDLGSVTLSY
jgi:hypothetical protein